jgi:riboflavin kinase / FMN adenylyltransferase
VLKIFRGIESYSSNRGACITTGTFDGVHLGHRVILNHLGALAKEADLESVIITFDPHPRRVLFPDQEGLLLINTLDEKLELLEKAGIDNVIVQPFTNEFSRTSALVYVRDLLVNQVGMKKLVIGYDHQFGKNREGSIEQLRELAPMLNFEVVEIPAQMIDDVNISSTKIRYALSDGDIVSANASLGYNFFINGDVVKGNNRGRSLGFPTANIELGHAEKILPKQGVYAVKVETKAASFSGMLNIGVNPTFGDSNKLSIEVNLFDFDEDLYGQKIRVFFNERIRNEMRFESVEELSNQMKNDKEIALQMLK